MSMDRKRALDGIFNRCVADLDLQQQVTGEAVSNQDIADKLEEWTAKVSQTLINAGFPPISEDEQAAIEFRLGQRRVNVNPGDQTIVLQGARAEPWLANTNVEWKFWENYCQLLQVEGKSPEVIQNHEVAIERALELSGDPLSNSAGQGLRRGLVMGNVQAGKTLNFIGLLNKALDVGYHTIIVLGGHMNELRAQAQSRIDAGVIYVHDRHDAQHPGLVRPHGLTTKEKDFSVVHARSFSPNLAVTPAVYVVKKHPGILERLVEWFTETGRESVLSKPLLLIDDEADYASINTMQSQAKFTRTNETIRKLLGIFPRATYVAYTATPFANVFIPFKDKDSGEELDDLFPADFMIKMPIPGNYVGQDFFFGDPRDDEDTSLGPCRLIKEDDHESWLKLKHKKDVEVDGLYWQLEDAIRTFLCVVALKDLRGIKGAHNTMLVNVSRFNLVQQKVALNIQDMLEEIKTQVRAYGAMGEEEAVSQSTEIAALRRTFNSEFPESEHKFQEVLEFLSNQSRRRFISVELVNGLPKPKDAPRSLDYEGNEEAGLSVIAVGGLKLSRGLTLEGLSVSYFFRNALAYDTLTQMCRWFGYRDGYRDLCRLFLLEESYDHYFGVARAIRGLYDDLKLMQLSNGTPRDFGLRVRTSDTALMITAKNKLGSARRIPFSLRLWGVEVQGLRLHKSDEKNTKNFEFAHSLVQRLSLAAPENPEVAESNGSLVFRDVPYSEVFDFVSYVEPIFSEARIQKPPILGAIDALKKSGVAKPTVVIFSRSSAARSYPGINSVKTVDGGSVEESPEITIAGHKIRMITRAMSENKNGEIYNRSVLIGDSDDLKLLFTREDLDRLNIDEGETFENKHIREALVESPVLVIYLFRAVVGPKDQKKLAHTEPSVAFTLHFPQKRAGMPHVEEMETTQEYFINEVLQGATSEDARDEDDEDDEQDY